MPINSGNATDYFQQIQGGQQIDQKQICWPPWICWKSLMIMPP